MGSVGQPRAAGPRRAVVVALSAGALASLVASRGGTEPPQGADASPTASLGAAQEETSGSSPADMIALGARLYAANCQVCHGARGGQGGMAEAPPHNETGHTWHHPDAQIRDWVLNGKLPGAMPGFKDTLSEEEVEATLSFIKTWWTPEQRASQADISERYQEALDRQEATP